MTAYKYFSGYACTHNGVTIIAPTAEEAVRVIMRHFYG